MGEAVGRNIVLLSDGTGNSAGKLFKTNVWRTYDALDLSNASQIAAYDDGVGTSSVKPLAVLGGAVGWGLKRNVISLYTFLCLNYRTGDRIYAFGFSRGAFTIRVLINFILSQGLVTNWSSNDDLRRKALRLYRKFRVEKTEYYGLHTLARPIRDALVWIRDVVRAQRSQLRAIGTCPVESIEFVGLWDTVDAYGLPIAELGKGVDQWIWPLSLGDKVLDGSIVKACHALAIDDKRTTFHPLLWDESTTQRCAHTDEERLTQVWFAGAHANIGGGYPDDSLSYVPLRWMIGEAQKRGLRFNPLAIDAIEMKVSPYGRIYNPRGGLGAYYRYDPRRLDPPRDRQGAVIPEPKIHETVVWRMAMGTDAYAPLSLPSGVRVVTEARGGANANSLSAASATAPQPNQPNILAFEDYRSQVRGFGDLFGVPAGASATDARRVRAAEDFDGLRMPDPRTLDLIWDTVWWRRLSYFVTLILTAVVLLFPALVEIEVGDNLVSRGAGLMAGFLPSPAHPWLDAFRSHTITFSLMLMTTMLFFVWGALLDRRIHDRALAAWTGKGMAKRKVASEESLRGRYGAAKLLVLPGAAAILLLVVAALLTGDLVLGVLAGLLGGAILAVEIPIALWWFILWRINKNKTDPDMEARGPALWLANRLRTWPVTAWPYRFFARRILPTAFAFTLIALAVYAASRIAFDFMQSAKMICDGGYAEALGKTTRSFKFDTNAVCAPADTVLKAKRHYKITVWAEGTWLDDGKSPVAVTGTSTFDLGAAKWLELPLRRMLTKPWFVVIARIGETGDEEYALKSGINEIIPTKSGKLYFFVNDAVIGLPDYGRFYRDNEGTVSIDVERVVDED